jgi:thiosulfate reductase cytochrome b subunit
MLGGPFGWGRSLPFQSAWFAVLTGLLYVVSGVLTQHFRHQLIPARSDFSWSSMRTSIVDHLRFKRMGEEESSNLLSVCLMLQSSFYCFR